MPVRTTNGANFFNTELRLPVTTTDLTFYVKSTEGAPAVPFYIVFEGGNETAEEVIYIDGEVTANSFVTTSLANRGLAGSAGGGPNEHQTGAPVYTAFVSQHLQDLQDLIDSKVGSGGTVEAGDGTTTAPSYSFANDLDSGLYLKSAGTLGVVANSTEVLALNAVAISSSAAVFRPGSGSVTAPGLSFSTDPNTGIYRLAEDQLAFATAGVRRGVITTSQWISDVPVVGPNGSNAAPSFSFASDPDTGIFRRGAGDLGFVTDGNVPVHVSTTHFSPAGAAAVDLGNTTEKWRDIHFSRNLTYNGVALTKWELIGDVSLTTAADISISGISSDYRILRVEFSNVQSTLHSTSSLATLGCRINNDTSSGYRYYTGMDVTTYGGNVSNSNYWVIGHCAARYDASDNYAQRTNGSMTIYTANGNSNTSPWFTSEIGTPYYGPYYYYSIYSYTGFMNTGTLRYDVNSLLFFVPGYTFQPGSRISVWGIR